MLCENITIIVVHHLILHHACVVNEFLNLNLIYLSSALSLSRSLDNKKKKKF
ncbi:hypothetical protein Scep_025411 [Stephania cephalantha]|uniref:Uncharacterized protein n=1 Tax=Stephania cephalantha TaxID=152367 RepID=A0AAP0HR67_9MAGN